MKIEHSDKNTIEFLDEPAMTFMILQAHHLNQALKRGGVTESSKRWDICYDFVFGLAYQVDAGWFMEGDVRLYPKVCLAERMAASEDEHLGEIERLHVPTNAAGWHGLAASVVAQYFEEYGETAKNIRHGSYDIEN